MAFHEVRFPDNISRGARGGPERRTQIVELASGDEERNASWANSRRRYDVAYGIRRADDLAAVVAFFEARNGRLYGFRYKEYTVVWFTKTANPLIFTHLQPIPRTSSPRLVSLKADFLSADVDAKKVA